MRRQKLRGCVDGSLRLSDGTSQQLGRYRLIRRVAKGGMAEVYLAKSQGARGFEKTVAIKRILEKFAGDEQFINMMVDEAKITVLLTHPNIAQTIEFGEEGGTYFIVMEYVPGQSLSALNKRLKKRFHERIGQLEASYIVVEMLQGLHSAHEQTDREGNPANIIHRDVSPQNCLIGYDGNTKIIDFGIAKAKDRIERTQIGTIKGKLRYLAPEMIDPGRFGEDGKFDRRVDVFAAGICLFELISGRQLFQGENEFDVYKNITDQNVPNLVDEGLATETLQGILERALARHATDRYRTAEEFADDLRAYVYRTDPGFKAQRISLLMTKCFEAEKKALANLEAEDVSRSSEMARSQAREEEAADRDNSSASRTKASRKRPRPAQKGDASQPMKAEPDALRKAKGPTASDVGEAVNPSAKTAMVTADQFEAMRAEQLAAVKKGLVPTSELEFDEATAALDTSDLSMTETQDATRLTNIDPFDEADTPATSTQHLPDRVRKTPWGGVIAAAAIVGVLLAIGGVLVAERVTSGSQGDHQANGTAVVDDNSADLGDLDATPPEQEDDGPIDGKVELILKAKPSSATVVIGSEAPTSLPLTISAESDTVVAVRFDAPGYKSIAKAIKVPNDLGTKTIEVELEPEPVEIIVNVSPPEAAIKVDGESHWEGQKVRPGERIKVWASAKGYAAVEQAVTAKPGKDLVVTIALKTMRRGSQGQTNSASSANKPANSKASNSKASKSKVSKSNASKSKGKKGRRTKKLVKKSGKGSKKANKPSKAKIPKTKTSKTKIRAGPQGILIVKAIPYWGRVQIDGKTYDDTTPLTVKLPVGKHKITVSHPPKGLAETFTVTIKAGKKSTRTVTFK